MSYTIIRRNNRLAELDAITELRRAPTLSAARRIAYEVAYRFFDSAERLGTVTAQLTISDILKWDGRDQIHINVGPESFIVSPV